MLRKFICLSAGLAVCGFGADAVAGPKVLQKAEAKAKLSPISIAPLYADGTIGEWRPYVGGDDTINIGGEFDAFESVRDSDPCGLGKGFPADGSGSGGFDPFCDPASIGSPCGAASVRWFFGSTYVSGGRRSGGNSAANSTGTAGRLELAWWNTLNPGQTDPNGNIVGDTVITVSTYDNNFDQFCGTGEPNFLTGVILNFGSVGAGGYYYSDVDLTGLELDVPAGGASVGVEVQFFYDTGLATVAANNQVMIWGAKDADEQGISEPIVYDDDNWDGTFDPFTECFDYTFGLCPDPLINMVGLFGQGGGGSCVGFDVPTLVAGSPATFDITGGQANANYAIAYYLSENAANNACDCADPLTANAGNFISCNGGTGNIVDNDGNPGNNRLDGAGDASLTVPIPNAAQGRTLWFVAYTPDADGTFCCVVSGPHTVL
ncbi:MAG: hypothetical protein ACF8PN_10220 [Phycisphaerales bacterium]